MRSQQEIQKAHDLLGGVILGEVPWPMKAESERNCLRACASCLCWVLEHDHNLEFPEWLKLIEAELFKLGYRLEKL